MIGVTHFRKALTRKSDIILLGGQREDVIEQRKAEDDSGASIDLREDRDVARRLYREMGKRFKQTIYQNAT